MINTKEKLLALKLSSLADSDRRQVLKLIPDDLAKKLQNQLNEIAGVWPLSKFSPELISTVENALNQDGLAAWSGFLCKLNELKKAKLSTPLKLEDALQQLLNAKN